MDADPRRRTPRTDEVLAHPEISEASESLGRKFVKSSVAAAIDDCRRGDIGPDEVVPTVLRRLPPLPVSMRRVINATGILIHTNLGRAALSSSSVEAVRIAAGTSDIEFDLATGARGPRGRGARAALAEAVPAAESVHIVNNGAAALALVASALATGRTIVISRGELVEIGDGFRIPELLESVGAKLREVGTTNRVRLKDYERAIDASVAFVLKVHPSNFEVKGFTSSVSIRELSSIPVPVVADIGSGLLSPHPRLPHEPDARSALKSGAALVTASGDKLLGGPQCGLILGRADIVERLRRHPLARALRVDKLTLAALEATLTGPKPPTQAALDTDAEVLEARASQIAASLEAEVPTGTVSWTASTAAVGGGGAPGVPLASAAITVPAHWAARLRHDDDLPVVGRVERDRTWLDLIAVPPDQDAELLKALLRAAESS